MINFENLDKAIFPGVGKYGIPEIAPTTEYPAGEFIPDELCLELQKSGRKKFAFFCG